MKIMADLSSACSDEETPWSKSSEENEDESDDFDECFAESVYGDHGVRQIARPGATIALDGYCYGHGEIDWANDFPNYYRLPIFQHITKDFGPKVSKEAEYANGRASTWRKPVSSRHALLLSKLTHNCLLEGKYDQAAFMMSGLSFASEQLPEQLWRVGLEILKECSPSMRPSILRFYSLMQLLCEPYQGEIVLDMAFYLLQRDKDIIQSYELLNGKINRQYCKRDPLVTAYVGLFEYVMWKIQTSSDRCNNPREFDKDTAADESDEEVIGKQDPSDLHFYAQRALHNLKIITESSGNWDMFLLKYIDLLDYHNSKEEAVKVLEEYREKNPENPNACRYLFWYLKKIKAEKCKLRDALEYIIKLDATSELAPELIEMWKEEDKMTNVIELLFERLDHPVCRASVYDWKELAVRLEKARKQPSDINYLIIQKCWHARKEWWHKFHFVQLCENKNQGQVKNATQKYIQRVKKALTNPVDVVLSDEDSSPEKRRKVET